MAPHGVALVLPGVLQVIPVVPRLEDGIGQLRAGDLHPGPYLGVHFPQGGKVRPGQGGGCGVYLGHLLGLLIDRAPMARSAVFQRIIPALTTSTTANRIISPR